ncbi:MAG: transposase [Bdellovibrio sp.]|nr:transposase [Bdellovibrio sp.]
MSLKSIVIEKTRKELSALSGLIFFNDLLNRLGFMGELAKILPRMQRFRGLAAKNKFKAAILAFIAGADCLDDLDDLREDQIFEQLCDGGVASTTMGKFLRMFCLKEIEQIQNFLPKLCLRLRQKFCIQDERIIITMDATGHKQYGVKMEGVEFDGHKKQLGLSSQNAFDQYGFCYGWDLRRGATHSSVGATNMIQKIFSIIPKDSPRYFRADSAYGNVETYNTLLAHDVKFAICLSEVV